MDCGDPYLIYPKLLYFTLNVLVYSTYTFTARFLEETWGITSDEFGFITAVCAISFSGSLLWTMLADRTGAHRNILALTAIAYAAVFSLLFLPMLGGSGIGAPFLLVCILYGAANIFTSALYPLLDCCILQLLSRDPRYTPELYGRQRLFGVFGQCFITMINGMLISRLGHISILYSLLASLLAFVGLVIFYIPAASEPRHQFSKNLAHPEAGFWMPAKTLVTDWKFVAFLVMILAAGIARGIVGNYLPQYLNKFLKMDDEKVGFILQTRLLTEIGIFFWGKNLLSFMGIKWVLFIGQAMGFVRVFAYAVIPPSYPWSMAPLVIELAKGINNACVLQAGVRFVYEYSPEEAKSTAQGLFSGTHSYLANAASGLLGYSVLKSHPNNYQLLFVVTSWISAAGIAIFFLSHVHTGSHPRLGGAIQLVSPAAAK